MRRFLLGFLSCLCFANSTRADIIGLAQKPAQGEGQGEAPALNLPTGGREVDEAIALFRQRNYDATLAKLAEAARARPELGPARLMLAKLFLLDNQAQNGRASLERAAVESPESPDVWLTLGKIALAEGRLAEAVTVFEKARGLLETSKLPEPRKRELRIEALSGLAAAAERRRDWPAAEAATRAWLGEDAGSVEARRRLAQAFFAQGKTDAAATELKRVAPLDPKGAAPAVALAVMATDKGEIEAAEGYLRSAVEAAPNDAQLHRAYAAWLLDRGRPDDAQAQIDAARKADPENDDVRLVAALIDLRLGRPAEAEATLEDLHAKSPGNFVISDRWARALAGQDDPARRQKAQQIAELNLRLYPNNPQAIATGAVVARAMGNAERAEQLLRAAVSGGAATSDIAYELARLVADRRGEKAPEIANLLKVALDADGPFQHREEARKWLASLSTQGAPTPGTVTNGAAPKSNANTGGAARSAGRP